MWESMNERTKKEDNSIPSFPKDRIQIFKSPCQEVKKCLWNPNCDKMLILSKEYWNKDGELVSTAYIADFSITKVLEREKEKTFQRIDDGTQHCKKCIRIAWNIDGSLFAIGGWDGNVSIWSADGFRLKTIGCFRNSKIDTKVKSIKWMEGDQLRCQGEVSGGIFDYKTGKVVKKWSCVDDESIDKEDSHQLSYIACDVVLNYTINGVSREVRQYVGCYLTYSTYDPISRILVANFHCEYLVEDKWIEVFKVHDDHMEQIDKSTYYAIFNATTWSPLGYVMASAEYYYGSESLHIQHFGAEKGMQIPIWSDYISLQTEICCMEFSPDGKFFAAGDKKGSIFVLNHKTRPQKYTDFEKGNSDFVSINSIRWNRNGTKFAVFDSAESCMIFDVQHLRMQKERQADGIIE